MAIIVLISCIEYTRCVLFKYLVEFKLEFLKYNFNVYIYLNTCVCVCVYELYKYYV